MKIFAICAMHEDGTQNFMRDAYCTQEEAMSAIEKLRSENGKVLYYYCELYLKS